MAPLALLLPAWVDPGKALYNFGDLYTYHYPMRHLVVGALQSGRLPFWNPYIFAGLPLSANSQAVVFYPATLLAYHWPLTLAFSWDYLFHLLWGGLGFYLLGRKSALGRGAAVFVTTLYCLSPFVIYRITEGIPTLLAALAWVPWAWLALLSGNRLLLAGVLALQFLSGHPQFMVINALGMSAWALVRRSPALMGRLALAGLGAAAMAAVQWVPTMEFLGRSVRKELPLSFTTAYSVGPAILKTWFSHNALGNPMTGTWRDVASVFFETCGVHVGPIGLFFALVWLVARRPPLALVLLGLGFFLALGGNNPLYVLAVKHTSVGYLRTPARYLLLCLLGLVFAAGGTAREVFAFLPRRWGVVLAATAVLGLAQIDHMYLKSQDARPFLAANLGFARAVGGKPVRFVSDPNLANPNKAMLYRAMNVNGYEAFYLADFARFGARSEGRPAADASRSYLTRSDTPEMCRAGVGYYFGARAGELVPSPRDCPLAHYAEAGGGRVAGPLKTAVARPERWELVGTMPGAADRLVLGQAFYPGWRAYLGGRELEVERWDGFLQAVRVPPGEFELSLVFRPSWWPLLALLAAAAWAAWLAAMVLSHSPPPAGETSSRGGLVVV